jgi:hypothetical protein
MWDLRTWFARHAAAGLVSGLASLRPRPGDVPGYATRIALRERGQRAEFPGAQLERPGELIAPLVAARAPGLLALHGAGPDTAALLLVAAGIARSGFARRLPGRTCARPPRSRHPPASAPATASIPAATARPTMPCGGS